MATEYRMVITAMFGSLEERDKAHDLLKTQLVGVATKAAGCRRADMTKDEYAVTDPKVTGYEAIIVS